MLVESSVASALAAVMGSLVGGSATFATAWITQRYRSRRELWIAEIQKRELLYGEFVAECTKLAIDAFAHSLERPETIFPVYALLNRIRLSSTAAVVAAADETVRRIADQYFEPNLSITELRELARSGTADPLRTFGQACRDELEVLRDEA